MTEKRMVCAQCGCGEFVARQVLHCDIVVDGYGSFVRNDIDPELEKKVEEAAPGVSVVSIYEHGRPFGPFECVNCHAEYDELSDAAVAKED